MAEKRKQRVLKALAKIGTGSAGDIVGKIDGRFRDEFNTRGVAQTLRAAAREGLVKPSGSAGAYTYSLTDAGRAALA